MVTVLLFITAMTAAINSNQDLEAEVAALKERFQRQGLEMASLMEEMKTMKQRSNEQELLTEEQKTEIADLKGIILDYKLQIITMDAKIKGIKAIYR